MPNRAPDLRLTVHALAQVQHFLLELYGTTDTEQLRRKIPAGLSALIAGDRVGFNEAEIGPTRRRVIPEPIPSYWRRLWPVYEAHAHEHPLLDPDREPPSYQVFTYRDLPPGWLSSTLYHDYFLAAGARHQLATHLYRRGAIRYNLNVNRSCLDFDEDERALLAFLSPHIAYAWRNAVTLSDLHPPHPASPPPDRPDQHVVVVNREKGVILWHSTHARAALRAYFAVNAGEGDALPEDLRRWLTAQYAALASCEALLAPPVPLVMRRPTGLLHVRLAHLCPTTAVLLLEERRTAIPICVMEGARLTPRENEILEWVAEGKRNGEIGLILGVSSRTVEKHLEHIFEKLGVETRTAAIRETLDRRNAQHA